MDIVCVSIPTREILTLGSIIKITAPTTKNPSTNNIHPVRENVADFLTSPSDIITNLM